MIYQARYSMCEDGVLLRNHSIVCRSAFGHLYPLISIATSATPSMSSSQNPAITTARCFFCGNAANKPGNRPVTASVGESAYILAKKPTMFLGVCEATTRLAQYLTRELQYWSKQLSVSSTMSFMT